jgi:hypothetical protein
MMATDSINGFNELKRLMNYIKKRNYKLNKLNKLQILNKTN